MRTRMMYLKNSQQTCQTIVNALVETIRIDNVGSSKESYQWYAIFSDGEMVKRTPTEAMLSFHRGFDVVFEIYKE